MKRLIAAAVLAAMMAAVPFTAQAKTDKQIKAVQKTAWVDVDLAAPFSSVPLDEDLQEYVIRLCGQYNIAPEIVFAVCWRESTFNASAIGDGGQALGLMQIQPKWYQHEMAELGLSDLMDPYQNVTLGCRILYDLSKDHDVYEALTYYRWGDFNGDRTYAEQVCDKAIEFCRLEAR